MKYIYTVLFLLGVYNLSGQKYFDIADYTSKSLMQVSNGIVEEQNSFSYSLSKKGDTTIYRETIKEEDTIYRIFYCVKDTCVQFNTYIRYPSHLDIIIDVKGKERRVETISLWIPRTPADVRNIVRLYRIPNKEDSVFFKEYEKYYIDYLEKEKQLKKKREKKYQEIAMLNEAERKLKLRTIEEQIASETKIQQTPPPIPEEKKKIRAKTIKRGKSRRF